MGLRLSRLLLAAALLVPALPSTAFGATSQTEIDQQKAALRQKIRDAEQRAKTITQQIADSDARRTELERKIASLTQQLQEATARLQAAEADLGVARVDLLLIEDSLGTTLSRLDGLQAKHDHRARSLYTGAGAAGYLELMLNSRSLGEFVRRADLVRAAMASDTRRQEAIGHLAEQLGQARTQAVQRKTDIEARLAQIQTERQNISRIKQEESRARQQVLNELAVRRDLLGKVQAEKAQYLRQMQQLERESRSISALLKSRQAGQVYRTASGLVWPTTGRISSGYGWRIHPIFGDRRFHTGVDIAAPSGQAVLASLPGTVVFAGTKSGYGLVVIIDHGNSFATVYAHLSAAAVYSGQAVGKSQRIGSVGCTGYCTGPHLHFETRVNGEPVDPMQYF